MKKIFATVSCLIFLWAVFQGYYRLTDKFKVGKILATPLVNTHVSTSGEKTKKAVRECCQQKFFYLGKGRQLFAFVSEDGKYVLKFFRVDKLTPRFWSQLRAFEGVSWVKKHQESKEEKRRAWSTSCTLAFEKLQRQTAMLALHLEETADLEHRVTLVDKIGRSYLVDLDNTFFILQKKCDLFLPTFKKLEDREKIISVMDAFFETVIFRYQQSIENQTRRCLDNIGLIDDQVVEFDVGEFHQKTKEWQSDQDFWPNFEKFSNVLLNWIKQEKPEYVEVFFERREKAWSLKSSKA